MGWRLTERQKVDWNEADETNEAYRLRVMPQQTKLRYAYVLPASVLHTAEAAADALSGKNKKQA